MCGEQEAADDSGLLYFLIGHEKTYFYWRSDQWRYAEVRVHEFCDDYDIVRVQIVWFIFITQQRRT